MNRPYILFNRAIVRSGQLTLTDQVYDALRLEIQAGRWEIGDRLPGIATLAAQSGLGRRILQRAFERLQETGYVELRGRSGTYLASQFPSGQTPLGSIGLILARSDALPNAHRDLYRLHTLLECLAERGWIAQTYYLDSSTDAGSVARRDGPFGERVKGILSLCSFQTDDALELPDGRLPVVFLSTLCWGCAPLVAEDTLFAFRGLTRLAVRGGHKHVLPLALNGAAYPDVEERFRGYAQALAEANLCPDRAAFDASRTTARGDAATLRRLLRRRTRATVAVCLTGESEDALLKVAREAKVRIPRDLSIIAPGVHALRDSAPERVTTGALYDWKLTVETGLDLLLGVSTTRRLETSTILLRPRICPGDTLTAPRSRGAIQW